jgi:hypothetical protein
MQREFESDQVRQGVELGVMRFVLGFSTAGAAAAMAALLIFA